MILNNWVIVLNNNKIGSCYVIFMMVVMVSLVLICGSFVKYLIISMIFFLNLFIVVKWCMYYGNLLSRVFLFYIYILLWFI